MLMYTFPEPKGSGRNFLDSRLRGNDNLKFSLSQYVNLLAISQEAKAKSLMEPRKKANA